MNCPLKLTQPNTLLVYKMVELLHVKIEIPSLNVLEENNLEEIK